MSAEEEPPPEVKVEELQPKEYDHEPSRDESDAAAIAVLETVHEESPHEVETHMNDETPLEEDVRLPEEAHLLPTETVAVSHDSMLEDQRQPDEDDEERINPPAGDDPPPFGTPLHGLRPPPQPDKESEDVLPPPVVPAATPARPGYHDGPHMPYPPPPHYPGYGSPGHGYYPPHMYPPLPPPPTGEGGAPAPYPPPPRRYDGHPPPPYGYGPPPGYPPYMPPYMYPPYGQHHMYGPPPSSHHHPPPPHYPYGGPDHSRGYPPPPGSDDPNIPPPFGRMDSRSESARGQEKSSRGSFDHSESHQDEDDDTESGADMANAGVSARLKTYIKPRIPSTQEVLDRRARKNAQSRGRAGKLRGRMGEIERKPPEERTEEERQLWEQYEARRRRKNDRSRERAMEKKEEIDRILAKPEKKRTKIEKQFLETALGAKKRKNEGDRMRRSRLKELGLSTKGTGVKPGVSARGPLPPQYQHPTAPPGYGGHHMPPPPGEIPMSPLPSLPSHHYGHQGYPQSPGGFGSPGFMMGFSPRPGGPSGRHDSVMPYMPGQGYDDARSPGGPGALDSHPSSRVAQRRNPDGSMSISIGGSRPVEPPYGGEPQDGDDADNMMMDHQHNDAEADGRSEGKDNDV